MKRTGMFFIAMTVMAIYACTPPPAPTAGTADDEQAIRALMERIATAWNNKDVADIAATVTDDYNGISPAGEHTQGRAAYEAAMTKQFAAERPEGFMLSIETGYIQWHGANVAAVGGTWSVAGLPEGSPNTGSWLTVVERDGTQWLVSNALVATFVPEPPAEPEEK